VALNAAAIGVSAFENQRTARRFRAMEDMQINIQTNPAVAGVPDARPADASARAFSRRTRPTLSRRELRRIIAETIG
jgi:hypothetical protein